MDQVFQSGLKELLQYGVLGIMLVVFIYFAIKLYNRQQSFAENVVLQIREIIDKNNATVSLISDKQNETVKQMNDKNEQSSSRILEVMTKVSTMIEMINKNK